MISGAGNNVPNIRFLRQQEIEKESPRCVYGPGPQQPDEPPIPGQEQTGNINMCVYGPGPMEIEVPDSLQELLDKYLEKGCSEDEVIKVLKELDIPYTKEGNNIKFKYGNKSYSLNVTSSTEPQSKVNDLAKEIENLMKQLEDLLKTIEDLKKQETELKGELDNPITESPENPTTTSVETPTTNPTETPPTSYTVQTLEEAVQDMKLRSTFMNGVYCEQHNPNKPAGDYSEQRHYVWNEATSKMEELEGVYYISSNGTDKYGEPINNALLQAKVQGFKQTETDGVFEKDGVKYTYNSETLKFEEAKTTGTTTEITESTYRYGDNDCKVKITTVKDANGNLISETDVYYDIDGQKRGSSTIEYTNGLPSKATYSYTKGFEYNGRERVVSGTDYYDEAGNKTSGTEEWRFADTGQLQHSGVSTYYNNVTLKSFELTNYNDDGDVESVEILYYDEKNGKLTETHIFDKDGNEIEAYYYDEDGNVITDDVQEQQEKLNKAFSVVTNEQWNDLYDIYHTSTDSGTSIMNTLSEIEKYINSNNLGISPSEALSEIKKMDGHKETNVKKGDELTPEVKAAYDALRTPDAKYDLMKFMENIMENDDDVDPYGVNQMVLFTGKEIDTFIDAMITKVVENVKDNNYDTNTLFEQVKQAIANTLKSDPYAPEDIDHTLIQTADYLLSPEEAAMKHDLVKIGYDTDPAKIDGSGFDYSVMPDANVVIKDATVDWEYMDIETALSGRDILGTFESDSSSAHLYRNMEKLKPQLKAYIKEQLESKGFKYDEAKVEKYLNYLMTESLMEVIQAKYHDKLPTLYPNVIMKADATVKDLGELFVTKVKNEVAKGGQAIDTTMESELVDSILMQTADYLLSENQITNKQYMLYVRSGAIEPVTRGSEGEKEKVNDKPKTVTSYTVVE